jgi:hypothetical protein
MKDERALVFEYLCKNNPSTAVWKELYPQN